MSSHLASLSIKRRRLQSREQPDEGVVRSGCTRVLYPYRIRCSQLRTTSRGCFGPIKRLEGGNGETPHRHTDDSCVRSGVYSVSEQSTTLAVYVAAGSFVAYIPLPAPRLSNLHAGLGTGGGRGGMRRIVPYRDQSSFNRDHDGFHQPAL